MSWPALAVGGRVYGQPVPKMRCASRPADDTKAEAHVFDIDLDDHDGDWDEALLSARASVPEGWVLLHVQKVD